jgi:hypothetical protein
MRFGMGLTRRSFAGVLTGLVTFTFSGLLLKEQVESSRAAWRLVRFAFTAACGGCTCNDGH